MNFTQCSCACPKPPQLSPGTLAPNSSNKSKAMLLAEKVRCLPGSLVIPQAVSATPTLDAVLKQGNIASVDLEMNQFSIFNCKCIVVADDKNLPDPQQLKITSQQIQLGKLGSESPAPANKLLGTDDFGDLMYYVPNTADLTAIYTDLQMNQHNILNCQSIDISGNGGSGAVINSDYLFVQRNNLAQSAGSFIDPATNRAVVYAADNTNQNKVQLYADSQNTVHEIIGNNTSFVMKDLLTMKQVKLTTTQLQLGGYNDTVITPPANKVLCTNSSGNLEYKTGLETWASTPVPTVNGTKNSIPIVIGSTTYYIPLYTTSAW